MRLAGQAKAGFYPTPPKVTKCIASHFKPLDYPVRLLDPCTGEGTALTNLLMGFSKTDLLTDLLKPETYGIELDSDRAGIAKEKLTRVINSDFFNTRISKQAFSLILLNPPYDYSLDANQRLEHKFLIACKDLLMAGGIMILIIPQTRLIKITARHLAAYYENIKVCKFPEPEYQDYKQIVIFATRKDNNIPNDILQAELEKVQAAFKLASMTEEVSTLPELREVKDPEYILPESIPDPSFCFRGYDIDPAEALDQVQKNGLWNDHGILELFLPQITNGQIRPLMPLKKGHIALLIASGFINNQILEDGDLKLIIKGKSFKTNRIERKERIETSEDGKEKEVTDIIEKERFDTVINAFNLNTGEFLEIK